MTDLMTFANINHKFNKRIDAVITKIRFSWYTIPYVLVRNTLELTPFTVPDRFTKMEDNINILFPEKKEKK